METTVEDGHFIISIEEESDWSTDGGYNFEMVTNTAALDKKEAEQLIKELNQFLST